jgi:aconitate hydratase
LGWVHFVQAHSAWRARKARALGLKSKPWVKTTLAPGSKVVMDYYETGDLEGVLKNQRAKEVL